MSNIDLSIIVPVYNVENYLRRGLDSILSQPSLINYEILLIDDDSSDKEMPRFLASATPLFSI